MKNIRLFTYLIILLNIMACQNDILDGYERKFIIEGQIENDRLPVVLLTVNKSLSSDVTEETLQDMVIRWAKVSVSDGETTEICTGKYDENYFPPFIYTGRLLEGRPGKTYTITVEYNEKIVATATTTIPSPVDIDRFIVEESKADSLFKLKIRINDPPEKNFYKIYTKIKGKQKQFVQAFAGNIDDNLFSSNPVTLTVNPGSISFPISDTDAIFKTEFNKKDTVLLKFCTMPKFGFDFWTAYEDEMINSSNPLFPASSGLPTNMDNGQMGIWCGYGSRVYEVVYNELKPSAQ